MRSSRKRFAAGRPACPCLAWLSGKAATDNPKLYEGRFYGWPATKAIGNLRFEGAVYIERTGSELWAG